LGQAAGQAGIALEMIKFQHTIFALPFALTGALLAAWSEPAGLRQLWGWPLFWIVAACYCARSAAMAFNRLADAEQDALNPRARNRALPAGLLTRRFAILFTVLHAAGFVLAAGMLNATALAFSPLVLAVLLGYSYTKRFTSLCHFFLGLALGMAPAGAWVAVKASLDWPPVVLGLGVMLWTAGFDLIYACQDFDFDRSQSDLHSLPKRLGIARALRLSAFLHVIAWGLFATMLTVEPLGPIYGAGLIAAAALLVYQHRIVSAGDLSRVNAAFFTANGLMAVCLFLAALGDAGLASWRS
jgi:4-hydroxybenzoate polyprenyltransferase